MSALAARGVEYDPLKDKSYQSTGLGMPIADYLVRKENQGRSGRTLDDKERYLATLALAFPNKLIHEFTVFDIDHWIALQPAKSKRMRASHINDFFEWARRWELVVRNPLDQLDPIARPGQKVYDIFTEPEVKALEGLPIEDGALMQILLDAGIRKGEARALCLRHYLPTRTLDAPHGELVILNGKGGKDRTVQATEAIKRKINALALTAGLGPDDHLWYMRRTNPFWGTRTYRDHAIPETSFGRWWDRCIDASGVRRRNPHMTRHTFATRWLRRGGRLETLTKVMGHASFRTTYDLYAHLDTRDVAVDLAIIEAATK